MAFTTDQLTAREMRDRGYVTVKVEHYTWFPGMKQPLKRDFLGFADYFCWNDYESVLVQTTSKSNHLARKKKIMSKEFFKKWVKNPNHKVLVQSWEKKGKGYICKDEYITLSMVEEMEAKKKIADDKEAEKMKGWTTEDFERALGHIK